MQLSDREIQNTIDLLRKKKQSEGSEEEPQATQQFEDIEDVVKQIGGAPEVRRDRVEKVRKALESSSYDVTGDDVAKKLIGRIFSDKVR